MSARIVLSIAALYAVACQPTPRVAGPEPIVPEVPDAGVDAAPTVGPADAAVPVDPSCRVRLEARTPADEHRYTIHDPGHDGDGSEGVAHWATDLNGDGVPELALELIDTGGSGGLTMWMLFVSCDAAGGYRGAWGPDYVEKLSVAPTCTVPVGQSTCWRDVQVVRSPRKPHPVRLRSDGQRYR